MIPNNFPRKDSGTFVHIASRTNSAGLVMLNTLLSVYVKSFDPDQDRYFVGPDLDPSRLQRLNVQAGDKSCHLLQRFIISYFLMSSQNMSYIFCICLKPIVVG